MEGICAIISYDGQAEAISSKIEKMARSLSDGEQLTFSKQVGEMWAMAGGQWSESHWSPSLFSYQDEKINIIGVADIHNLPELANQYGLPKDEIGSIVARCYAANPSEWAKHFRGSFSIIIFEKNTKKVVAATDRVGIRPLYWLKQGNTYYLSSRINAIRQVCKPLDVDNNSIFAYLYYEMIPSPNTIFKGLYKLEPGVLLKADDHNHVLFRYWDIMNSPKLSEKEDDIARNVHSTIKDAVKVMNNGMAAEKEVACFLSGGTDSSSICGLLSQMTKEPVNAYSMGFSEAGYDEMSYARIAAKAFGLEHHEYYITPEDLVQSFPNIVRCYDEPFGNSSVTPAYFCAKLAEQNGFHYMLAGDGGDEVFSGNERYGTQQVFRNYFKIPSLLRNGLIEPLLLNRLEKIPFPLFQKGGRYIRRAKMPDARRIYSYRYVTYEEMFTPAFLETCDIEFVEGIVEKHFNQLKNAEALDRHLYLDMKMTITDNDLRKVSRMCDLAHVRVRYPLLDSPVIDLGFRIPVNLKLKGTSGLRHIFKKAFQDFLPQEIIDKQKHGFGLPISNWLRNEPKIKDYAYELLFNKVHLQRGYLNREYIHKLWQLQLTDNTPYYGSLTWLLMMLEGWHRIYIDGNDLATLQNK